MSFEIFWEFLFNDRIDGVFKDKHVSNNNHQGGVVDGLINADVDSVKQDLNKVLHFTCAIFYLYLMYFDWTKLNWPDRPIIGKLHSDLFRLCPPQYVMRPPVTENIPSHSK